MTEQTDKSLKAKSLISEDDRSNQPKDPRLGTLEIVEGENGKISVKFMVRDHRSGQLRPAKEINPQTPEGKEHLQAHRVPSELVSVVFLPGNCYYYLNKWWC